MVVAVPKLLPCLLLFALALAGCTGGGDGEPTGSDFFTGTDTPTVQATATTGGIRGVVVDDTITPIKGAVIEILNTEKAYTTAEDGLFAISGLEPGTYFIKASHPLYSEAQQSADVVAGVDDPPAIKMQLVRTIFAEPYLQTLSFEGFIACSTNIILVAYSEECGQGVGSPEDSCFLVNHPPSCVPNPVMPGQRIGQQPGNNPQFDFTVSVGINTTILEIIWTATSEAGKAFYSPVSTNWLCDPFCGGNRIIELNGESPLYGRFESDVEELDPTIYVYDETPISVFTWAAMNEENPAAAVLLNQKYQVFVTNFYYVPAPEGWSFVAGSPDPFA